MSDTLTEAMGAVLLVDVDDAPDESARSVAATEARAPVPRAGAEVEALRGDLRVLRLALRAVAVAMARRTGVVLERWGDSLGADDEWWAPAGSRTLRRARAVLRRGEAARSSGDAPDAPATGKRTLRWVQALAVGLCAFTVWALLDAPTLLRNAQGSPYGARRTAAIAVLRPLAAVSRDLGLSHVVGAADRVMGRTGGGVLQVVGPSKAHPRPSATHRARPPASAPATDASPPLPAPTAAAPLRVLSMGDSLGVDFGGPFVNDLATTGVVNGILDAHIDTGLARPDYFDWPGELQGDLAKYQPQVVVVFLGANDPQNMVEGDQALAYGTPAWSAVYAARVGSLMQQITASGARAVWVGMPPMADPALNAKMQVLDGIYQDEAGAHPGVTYLSSWPVLSDPQGDYAEYLPDQSGSQVQVREPDGTHMSPAGAERLSEAVISTIDRSWGLTLQP